MDPTSLADAARTHVERARAADALAAVEDSALLLTVSAVLGSPDAVAATAGGPLFSWQEDWS